MVLALVAGSTSALEAMGHFAGRALVILKVLVLKDAEVVAVVCAAFKVASWVAGLHNHFPLKSLPSVHFLLVQEHLEVIFGLECVLAVGFWASDWKLAHVDLSFCVFSQALSVEKALAGSVAMDGSLFVVFIKERHQAD